MYYINFLNLVDRQKTAKIQTQGQATAPHSSKKNTQATKLPAATQAELKSKRAQEVTLSPKALPLSKQALEQKTTEEDKLYQFKNPDSYLDRIINNRYDSNLLQQSLRMTSGSGDSAIYLTDSDRERLKEAYIYADKNGLDAEAVSLTAFRLSDLRNQQAQERNGTLFAPPATKENELKDLQITENDITYRDENGVLQHGLPDTKKELTWDEYYKSSE